ncbi:MAG: gamma-glutamylcyclotransferase [Pseudomonadota bacterium]|nr:gamma-glutamylcyclotransferase [Pseudomonadota bacterium]
MTYFRRLNIKNRNGLWIFAYGSLMWDPPFQPTATKLARLYGYHRSFCVRSETYRGTPDRPGLSLGLDRGGSCTGLALRIGPTKQGRAIDEINKREIVNDQIYLYRRMKLHLPTGRVVGYALIVNRNDPAYEGSLSFEETARRIASCSGTRGSNIDYLSNVISRLEGLRISEKRLRALLLRTEEIAKTG